MVPHRYSNIKIKRNFYSKKIIGLVLTKYGLVMIHGSLLQGLDYSTGERPGVNKVFVACRPNQKPCLKMFL